MIANQQQFALDTVWGSPAEKVPSWKFFINLLQLDGVLKTIRVLMDRWDNALRDEIFNDVLSLEVMCAERSMYEKMT